mmetsp:Transcript_10741/g.13580  ORF Transcript_10741/g.13580 Transcript_10741/m.13580 type:complete len:191 (-) Transcript_10741:79-651(-)
MKMTSMKTVIFQLLSLLTVLSMKSSTHFNGGVFFVVEAISLPAGLPPFIADTAEVIIDVTDNNIIQPLKEQYDNLPPKGKFVSMAIAGFATSRVTVRTSVKAIKYTGAAFIISEVLNHAGILDDIELSEESTQVFKMVKRKITSKVNDCRLLVRKHCSMHNIRDTFDNCIEKDKLATLGFTTGAVAGLVL